MKKFIFAVFISVYFISVIKPYAPVLSYSFNKTIIISKFCENKTKPQMHCEGKCHLKKELDKASKDEAKLPVASKISIDQICQTDHHEFPTAKYAIIENILISIYSGNRSGPKSLKIFEPPRLT
jgi:hypothetical protein